MQSTFTTVIFIHHQLTVRYNSLQVAKREKKKLFHYGISREWERATVQKYWKKKRKKNKQTQQMTKTIFASMRSIEKCHWMDLVNEKERSWCCEVTTWRQLQMSINARMQSGRFNTESAETLKRGEHTHKMIQVKHRSVCCFHNNNFIPKPKCSFGQPQLNFKGSECRAKTNFHEICNTDRYY